MIELLAIADGSGPPMSLPEPLGTVASNNLAAVYAPAADRGAPTAATFWRHEELLESLMLQRDLLPVRYGTRLEDERVALRLLDERHEELSKALTRVRGAVELAVRVIDTRPRPAEEEPPATGAQYVSAKRRAAAIEDEVARVLHDPLTDWARATQRRAASQPNECLRAAYLIERTAVGGFVRTVGRLQRQHPRLHIVCTGPWPPYSFTEDE